MTTKKVRVSAAAALAVALLLAGVASAAPKTERAAPEITANAWLNSEPLTLADLRGEVVLVEFWTFACWNCQNIEPHVKRWHEEFRGRGLRVVAIHCPEFEREKQIENVERYLKQRGITYPVAIDNDFTTWNRYGNRYWPTLYLIDRRGAIRHVRIGEGGYAETEAKLRELLAETGTLRAPEH
jgi:thiol-disulfide isomerase/thioredoxin